MRWWSCSYSDGAEAGLYVHTLPGLNFLRDQELPFGHCGINDCETTALISLKVSETVRCCTGASDSKLRTGNVAVRGEIVAPHLDTNSKQTVFLRVVVERGRAWPGCAATRLDASLLSQIQVSQQVLGISPRPLRYF